MNEGNLAAILAILTPILACITTIVGLYFKDKADARRWQEVRKQADGQHRQNVKVLNEQTQTLATIEENVNGKMAQLIDKVAEKEGC